MQDLTTGSLTGHLLKTTGFMLVSMIFQTLYILVDLFWVGRLGTDAVAAVGLAGNLSFIVIAITQVLGVGATTLVSHASGKKDQDRAIFLFNQSQVLSMAVAAIFLLIAMLLRHQYAAGQSATEGMRIATEQYLLWFIPAMALQFAMVAMGAALRGTGNFKPGMIVQTATVVINMVIAPFLIFGWGPFPEMGVSGAAVATFVVDRRRRDVDLVLLHRRQGVSAISFRPLEAAAQGLVGDVEDRPAGRRRVRVDGHLHGRGLCDHQAIRRGCARRLHDRPARRAVGILAGRGAGLCRRAGGRTELRGAQRRSRARGIQSGGRHGGGCDAGRRNRDVLRRRRR